MIERLEGFPDDVLAFSCHGHVTRDDYLATLVPAVERALTTHDCMRIYYEVASDFEGIDPGAVLEDVKVGVENLRRWERGAVVTDVPWIGHAVSLFGFLMPGELRVFPPARREEARAWIRQHDD
ncbi:MAG: STAS/SEC14 domain-containing protein [Myxococcota bacterium]